MFQATAGNDEEEQQQKGEKQLDNAARGMKWLCLG